MAGYSTSNPPERLVSNLDGTFNIWVYRSVDATTLVDIDGYFTNGWDLGMRPGDIVFSVDTDASPVVTSLYYIATATAADGVDLTEATVLTATNND